MSHYPQNPSYGSAFQSFSYPPPPGPTASPNNGPPPYQHFVPPRPQGFPYGFPGAANSQIPPISPQFGQGMTFHNPSPGTPTEPASLQPQPPFNLWPHLPPSSIAMPPPPLPPPPPPSSIHPSHPLPPLRYNHVSQFASPTSSTVADATFLNHSASRQYPSLSHSTSSPQHLTSKGRKHERALSQNVSHKEDGELSDGETSSAAPIQREPKQMQPLPPAVRIGDSSYTHPPMVGIHQSQLGVHNTSRFEPDFAKSPRDQSRKPLHNGATRAEPRPATQSHSRKRKDHQGIAQSFPSKPESSARTASGRRASQDAAIDAIALKFLDTERRKAKDFILLLHENGYGFPDLAQHGLDQAMLIGLYEELNLPLSSEMNGTVEASVSQSDAPSQVSSLLAGATVQQHGQGPQKPIIGSLQSNLSPLERIDTVGANVNAPITSSASQADQNKDRQIKSVPSTKVQTALPSLGSDKSTNGVSLERKDVIARLMAAKTRKPALTSTPANLPPKPAPPIPETLPETPSSTVGGSSVAQLGLGIKTSGETTPQVVEDKRKAQTELVRLRTEALESARRAMAAQAKKPRQGSKTTPEIRKQLPSDGFAPASEHADIRSTSFPTDRGIWIDNERTPAEVSLSRLNKPELATARQNPTPDVGIALLTPEVAASVENVAFSSGKFPQLQSGTHSSSLLEPQATKVRKRPVAADFDDTSHLPPLKRPFGQDRHDSESEGIIIEASTEDSDSERDSLDSDFSENEHSSRFFDLPSKPRPMNLRDLPPLSNSNARSANGRMTGQSTTATSQNPAVTREVERLKQQEQEILEMKRKIAQAEEKRKARGSQSGNSTPVKAQLSTAQAKHLNPRYSTQTHPSGKRATPGEKPVIIDEPLSSSPSLDTSANWRQQRRAEIQSGLPALEASYVSNSSRLEELRAQMKEIEGKMQQELEDKNRLVSELENLGIDTEGMRKADLLAAKLSIQGQTKAAMSLSTSVSVEPTNDRASSAQSSETSMSMSNSDKEIEDSEDSSSDNANMAEAPHSRLPALESSKTEADDVQPTLSLEAPREPPAESPVKAILSPALDQLDEADSDDDLYGSESGEVESNDPKPRDRPEGTPGEAINPQDVTKVADEDNADESDVSDFYSTTAAATPQKDLELNDSLSSDKVGKGQSESSLDAIQGLESPDEAAFQKVLPISHPISASPLADEVADHLTSENTQGLLPAPSATLSDNKAFVTSTTAFKPYESPLKQFKKYRLHPQFGADISGGIQSLSYSHHIDPDVPMCEFEIAGGVCNDGTCDSQHFRSIALHADGLVAQLAGANPGETEADAAQWRAGLQNIIASALLSGTLGSPEVAHEVSSLWKRLSTDSTKILGLHSKGPANT